MIGEEFNELNDKTLQGFPTCGAILPMWNLKAIFINNALVGVAFNLLFNIIVLVINTKNIYLSLIAIFSIIAVILSLISIIPIMGWQFGLVESSSVIVFIGVSFDYVVHICH